MMANLPDNATITILTGAGISAESGLDTFRGNDGLWADHRIEDVATPDAFHRDPDLVHQFYNQRRRQLLSDDVRPNDAHIALSRLQQNYSGQVHIITQNVDNLHEAAGSSNVIHMHGELLSILCNKCHERFDFKGESSTNTLCPKCNRAGGCRPDVVWFGEMPYHMDRIQDILMSTDLLLSIGTSGQVYPAAGFLDTVHQSGNLVGEINLEPTRPPSFFDYTNYGPATQTCPAMVEEFLS
jgi:NAD-dependent deacetylase